MVPMYVLYANVRLDSHGIKNRTGEASRGATDASVEFDDAMERVLLEGKPCSGKSQPETRW